MFQFNTSSNTQEDTLSAWKVTQWILSYSAFCLFPPFKLWRYHLRPFLTGDSNLLYSVCRFHHHLPASSIAKWCLTAIPWTAACQTPLSMGFLWQEYWNGLPFPSPWPRDRTHVSWVSCSHTGRQILYHCVTWEAHIPLLISLKKKKKTPSQTHQ